MGAASVGEAEAAARRSSAGAASARIEQRRPVPDPWRRHRTTTSGHAAAVSAVAPTKAVAAKQAMTDLGNMAHLFITPPNRRSCWEAEPFVLSITRAEQRRFTTMGLLELYRHAAGTTESLRLQRTRRRPWSGACA
jgi:hypothetical protein